MIYSLDVQHPCCQNPCSEIVLYPTELSQVGQDVQTFTSATRRWFTSDSSDVSVISQGPICPGTLIKQDGYTYEGRTDFEEPKSFRTRMGIIIAVHPVLSSKRVDDRLNIMWSEWKVIKETETQARRRRIRSQAYARVAVNFPGVV